MLWLWLRDRPTLSTLALACTHQPHARAGQRRSTTLHFHPFVRAMSADLFAEFGADSPSDQQQSRPVNTQATTAPPAPSEFSFFNSLTNTPIPASSSQQPPPVGNNENFVSRFIQESTAEDNDDWGDFEGGTSTEPAPPTTIECLERGLSYK